jgi:hypothetical protein
MTKKLCTYNLLYPYIHFRQCNSSTYWNIAENLRHKIKVDHFAYDLIKNQLKSEE